MSTSAEFNERNQELFVRRNEARRRITEIEKLIAAAEKAAAKPAKASAKQAGSTKTKTVTRPRRAKAKQVEPEDLEFLMRRARSELDAIDTEIIQLNYGLVLNYVRKFTSTTSREDSRDFEGAAVLGLMRAISTYDPTKGSKFSTWAYKPIQRECLKAVRDADFKQLNPGDFEKRPDVLRALKQVRPNENDPMPDMALIAAAAGTTIDTVKRVLNAPEIESLSRPVSDDGKSYLGDIIPDVDPSIEDTVLAKQELTDLESFGLSALDDRELYVIARRFGLDAEPPQRLSAIGTLLGLSREAVRQVESKGLSKLNHPVVRRKLMRHGRE